MGDIDSRGLDGLIIVLDPAENQADILVDQTAQPLRPGLGGEGEARLADRPDVPDDVVGEAPGVRLTPLTPDVSFLLATFRV